VRLEERDLRFKNADFRLKSLVVSKSTCYAGGIV
jgi:hypothetical protein